MKIITKSTYQVINDFNVTFYHVSSSRSIQSKLEGIYKAKYLKVLLEYSASDLKCNGKVILDSSMEILKKSEFNFSSTLNADDKHSFKAALCYNNQSLLLAKIQGNFSSSTISADWEIISYLLNNGKISGTTFATMTEYSLKIETVAKTQDLQASLNLYVSTHPQMEISLNITGDQQKPVNLWFKFLFSETELSIQGEMKFEHIQILAINVKFYTISLQSFSLSAALKLISRKISFVIEQSERKKYLHIEILSGNSHIFNSKSEIINEKLHNSTILSLNTLLYTCFDVIKEVKFVVKVKNSVGLSGLKIDFSCNEKTFSLVITQRLDGSNSEILSLSAESNLSVIEKLNVVLEKYSQLNNQSYTLSGTYNEKTIKMYMTNFLDVNGSTNILLKAEHFWGFHQLEGKLGWFKTLKTVNIAIQDSNENNLSISMYLKTSENDINVNGKLICMSSDPLELQFILRRGDCFNGMITIIQQNFTYVNVSGGIKNENNKFIFNAQIDANAILGWPVVELNGTLEFKNKHGQIQEIVTNISFKINAFTFFRMSIYGSKNMNIFNGHFLFTSNISELKKIEGKAELQLSESKIICNLNFKKNTANFLVLLFKIENAEFSKTMEMKILFPTVGLFDFVIDASLNLQHNSAILELKREDKYLRLLAKWSQEEKKHELQLQIESSSYSWKILNAEGSVSLAQNKLSIDCVLKSDDQSHSGTFSTVISPQYGVIKIQINLPMFNLLNRNSNLTYLSTSNSFEMHCNFSGEEINGQFEFSEDAFIFHGETPFEGYTKIIGKLQLDKTSNFLYFLNLNVELDNRTMSIYWTLFSRNDLYFEIEADIPMLSNFKSRMKIIHNNFDLEVLVNNYHIWLNAVQETSYIRSNVILKIPSLKFQGNYSQNWISNEKEIALELSEYGQNHALNVRLSNTSFYIQTQTPLLVQYILDLSWKKDDYRIFLEYNRKTLFKFRVNWKWENLWIGEFDIEAITYFDIFKLIKFKSKFDLHTDFNKSMEIESIYNNNSFKTNLYLNATHDTLSGILLMRSSLEYWNNIKLGGYYNIKANPEARLHVMRNNITKDIYITVFLDSLIPSVFIKTSWEGFEEIKIEGNLISKTNKKDIFILVSKNNQKMFSIESVISWSPDWRRLEYQSKYLSELFGYDTDISIIYDGSIFNTINLFVKTHNGKYTLSGLFSVPEMYFFIDLINPSENITLSGQFGTTQIKTSYSSTKHKVKRDVSFDCAIEKDEVSINVNIPNMKFTGIKVTAYQPNQRSLDIKFEAKSMKYNFIWGLSYDFVDFMKFGRIASNISIPLVNIDYGGEITYSFGQVEFPNGFSSKILICKDANICIAGKIQRIPGKTEIFINTPIEDFKDVFVYLKSDWKTYIDISIKSKLIPFRIFITQNSQDMSLLLNTSFHGFENVSAVCEYGSDLRHIKIFKNGELVTTVRFSGKIDDITHYGHIEIKWDAPGDKFIYVKIEIKEKKANLLIETSFTVLQLLQVQAAQKLLTNTEKTKINILYNDYNITYNSSSSWLLDNIESNTTLHTNLPHFGFRKSETFTKIVYCNNLVNPFSLHYKVVHDGDKEFEIFSSVTINMKDGEIEMIYQGDLPLNNGKINALLHIKSDFSTKLEMTGQINQSNFKMILVQSGINAQVLFKSNIPNYENIRGLASWKIGQELNKKYGVETKFIYRDNITLGFSVELDTFPFSQFEGNILVPGYLDEKINFVVNSKDNSYFSIKGKYEGFNVVEFDASLDFHEKIVILTVDNKSANRKWHLKAKANLVSESPVKINLILMAKTPFTDTFESLLDIDFLNDSKLFKFSLNFGILQASLQLNIVWSEKNLELLIQAFCPLMGIENMDIKGVLAAFQLASLMICINDKVVNLHVKNQVTDTSFDIEIKLNLPLQSYESIIVSGKGRSNQEDMGCGAFIFSIVDQNFTMIYTFKQLDFDMKFKTPLMGAHEISLKSKIVQFETYTFILVCDNITLNLEHKLNMENFGLNVRYTSSLSQLKKLSIDLSNDHNRNLSLHIDYAGEAAAISFNTNIKILNTFLAFEMSLIGDNTTALSSLNLTKFDSKVELSAFFEVGTMLTMKVKSILNLEGDNQVDFKFILTSSIPTLKLFSSHLIVKHERAKEATAVLIINEQVFKVNMGSSNGHIFVEAKSPIKDYEHVKMDINHQNGNLKVNFVVGLQMMEANFIRKTTIYNFEVRVNGSIIFLRFDGKIDITGKALQTSIVYNEQKMSMKANYNGKHIFISLKSTFRRFENILFNGKWAEIPDGFNVKAAANVNKLFYEFESEFTRDVTSTVGFWRAKGDNTALIFNLAVNKSSEFRNILISIDIPGNRRFECETGYVLKHDQFGGHFHLKTPFENIVSKLGISFLLKGWNSKEITFDVTVDSYEKLCNIKVNILFVNICNISSNFTLNFPFLYIDLNVHLDVKVTSFGLEFFITARHDRENYEASIIFKIEKEKSDALLKIVSPNFKKDLTLNLEYSPELILIKINEYYFQVQIDRERNFFTIHLKLNFALLYHYLCEDGIAFKRPKSMEAHFSIHYVKVKEFQVVASIETLGEMNITFIKNPNTLVGTLIISFPKYDLKKILRIILQNEVGGFMEFYFSDGESILELQSEGSHKPSIPHRRVRAAITSPELGSFTFDSDKAKHSGVFVLSLRNQIHKISYDVKNSRDHEITIHAESPLLENGYATCKLSIDSVTGIYRVQVGLNNDHFISGFIELKDSDFRFNFDIETREIPYKLSCSGSIVNKREGKSIMLQYFYKTKNSIILGYSKDVNILTFFVEAESKHIPQEKIELNCKLLLINSQYDISLKLAYGKESAKLSLFLDVKNVLKFSANASFVFSRFLFSNGDIHLLVDADEERPFHLEINAAHPTSSKLLITVYYYKCENSIIVTSRIILPIEGFEYYDVKIEINKIEYSKPCHRIISLILSTPFGQTQGKLNYSLEGVFLLKINFPRDKSLIIEVQAKTLQNMYCSVKAKFSSFEYFQLECQFKDENASKVLDFNMSLEFSKQITKIIVNAQMQDGIELKLDMETPYYVYEKISICIGFANSSEKKMFNAHWISNTTACGVKFAYEIKSYTNFVVLMKIDFPYETWTDVTVDFAYQNLDKFINIRFGGQINDAEVLFTFLKSSSKLESIVKVNACEIFVSFGEKLLENLSIKHFLTTEIQTYFATSKVILTILYRENQFDGEMLISVNGKNILKIRKVISLNEMSLEAQDIFFPFKLAAIFRYDSDEIGIFSPTSVSTIGFETTLLLNYTNTEEVPIVFKTIARRTTNGYEGSIYAKFKEILPVTAKLILDKQTNVTLQLAEIYEGSDKLWGYEVFCISYEDHMRNLQHDETLKLKTPLYALEYDFHIENYSIKKSSSADIKLIVKGEVPRGIGYLYTSETKDGIINTSIAIRRPIGSKHEDQIINVQLNTFPGHALMSAKIGHSEINKRFSLQVSEILNKLNTFLQGV